MNILKRTWAEVSLDALEHNYNMIRNHVGRSCRFLGVVKADAYGHGAVPVGRTLTELGAEYLAVCNLDEAVQLRRGGVDTPVLILGYTPAEYAQELVQFDLTQEIHSLEYAVALNERLGGTTCALKVHLKFDTGMSRIGFFARNEEELEQAAAIADLEHLRIEGAFMHFSVADSNLPEHVAYTKRQYETFCNALQYLEGAGIYPALRHCCNSGASIQYPEYGMDMIRSGIMTYGASPFPESKGVLPLKPLLCLRTTVMQVRNFPAGTDIGYGRTFTTERPSKIAVLAIGYADGLSRTLSGKIRFLINGCAAPQIGRICMDLCMVDVTDIPEVSCGDEAVLIGCSGDLEQTAEHIADTMGTISYEVFCDIGKRVPRIYHHSGKIVETLQYIV